MFVGLEFFLLSGEKDYRIAHDYEIFDWARLTDSLVVVRRVEAVAGAHGICVRKKPLLRIVRVLSVGHKEHNVLFIRGRRVEI